MTLISQHWLTAVIVLLILVIIIDGIRRMLKARKDSIKMALRSDQRDDPVDDSGDYGSEFPNGGARKSEQEIDRERIQEARKRFNFGDDLPSWKNAVKAVQDAKEAAKQAEPPGERLEPSIGEEPIGEEVINGNTDPLQAITLEESSDPLTESPVVSESVEAREQAAHHSSLEEPLKKILEEPLEELDELDMQLADSPAQYSDVAAESTSGAEPGPVQTSLDLDEAVPMLMDEVEGTTNNDSDETMDDSHVIASQVEIEPVFQGVSGQAAKITPSRSANKPRFESRYTDISRQQAATEHEPIRASRDTSEASPQRVVAEVIVINLKARDGDILLGADLLDKILDNGLRFGDMGFFHRHAEEDGEGAILFSMANLVKPGTFELSTFESFETIGLSFFMAMPVTAESNMDVFELMLITAQTMAETLNAELLDEQRSVLTGQTIEHYRERIRDFSRRQQLGKI